MTDATSHEIQSIDPSDGLGPDDVSLETIESGLESDDDQVRTHAAKVTAVLSQTDVEPIEALLPTLSDLLDDRWNVVVYQISVALSEVAKENPERLEPAIPGIVGVLQRDLPVLQILSARTLGHVAVDHPGLLADHVDALLATTAEEPSDVLDTESLETVTREKHKHHRRINAEGQKHQTLARGITANVLVEVADHDSAAVKSHAARVIDLLSEDDGTVVAACADVVGILAREDRDVVADAVDPLIAQLDHFDDSVVANVVSALGYVGDPAAADPLRDVAADDERDEDLRELASDTADFLEEQ